MKNALLTVLLVMHGFGAFCQCYPRFNSLAIQGKYKEGLREAKALAAQEPMNAYPYFAAGYFFLKESMHDSAIAYLTKAIQMDKDSASFSLKGHMYLGCALIKTGKIDNGIAELNKAGGVGFDDKYLKGVSNGPDSIGYHMPEKDYEEGYLPNWVTIDGKFVTYKFQDTAGLSARVSKFILEDEAVYEKINQVFEAKLPRRMIIHVWKDPEIGKKILHRRLWFVKYDGSYAHVHLHSCPGAGITSLLPHWSWGTRNEKESLFITDGIALCFMQCSDDKYATAKDIVRKYGTVDVLKQWKKGKRYKRRKLYCLTGAFVHYLYSKSTNEQFKALVKNQSLENAKKIYGNSLEEIVNDFNKLVGMQ